jgi:nucleoside 2-deoxyribosyltransferase
MSIKIYLAGPDVFLPDAAAMGRRKQQICEECGFVGLFPLDYDTSVSGDAAKIFRANCHLMKKDADVGLFNLTPFRGPSPDAGTSRRPIGATSQTLDRAPVGGHLGGFCTVRAGDRCA